MPGKNSENSGVNRRKVLKSLGAASTGIAVGAAGGTQSATAQTVDPHDDPLAREAKAEQARAAYETPETIRQVLLEHRSFVRTLAQRDYAPGRLIGSVTSVLDARTYTKHDEGVIVTAVPTDDGGYEPDIIVKRTAPSGVLQLHIQPQSDKIYAILEDEGESDTIIRPSNDDGDVGIMKSCATGWHCIENYRCCAPCGCNVGTCHRKREIKQCDDGTCDWGNIGECCAYPDPVPCYE